MLAQTYPTDIDDLWDAVTSAERIPRWMLPITGDLRLGAGHDLAGTAMTSRRLPTPDPGSLHL